MDRRLGIVLIRQLEYNLTPTVVMGAVMSMFMFRGNVYNLRLPFASASTVGAPTERRTGNSHRDRELSERE